MILSFCAVRSNQLACMSMRFGPSDLVDVRVVRREFGIGKGRWKRRLCEEFPAVTIKTRWYGLWAAYTLTYEGHSKACELLWSKL